jgi:CRP/FNR family transcriptional regulator
MYVLKKGVAAVSVSSSEGRVVILRLAHAGEVLGLNCVLCNSFYDTTVKTLAPCWTDFMSRAELIEFSEKSQAGANALLRLLSRELTQLTERTRSLLLPQTASARLANLLLECGGESTRIEKVFTQEDIAQMIGSSRETVTRLLTVLRRRNIIQITTDSVLIRDRRALENMLESKEQIEPVLCDMSRKV